MRYHLKAFSQEEDYWRVRAFLREVFLVNGRHEHSWQPYRLDYWRWHIRLNCFESTIEGELLWWEDDHGRVVAAIHTEGNSVWLEVHPAVRSTELEEHMVRTAMEHLARPQDDGTRQLVVWACDADTLRLEVLQRLGFAQHQGLENVRYADFTQPLPSIAPPAGYSIRSMGGPEELPSRSWASWTAFHPNEPDSVYEGWHWYPNVQRCPLYRRDLDVVAISPQGEVVSFCTAWYDDATRTAGFEPVGTHKEYHQRGLASAVVREAQRRAHRLGATLGTIGSWNDITDKLYGRLGFQMKERLHAWSKRW